MPAPRSVTVAVVPTSFPVPSFQEYLIVPLAPLTAPAITEPVAPQLASVLVDVARASVEFRSAMVAVAVVLHPLASVMVTSYLPAPRPVRSLLVAVKPPGPVHA